MTTFEATETAAFPPPTAPSHLYFAPGVSNVNPWTLEGLPTQVGKAENRPKGIACVDFTWVL